jgi:hypothetical protein
MPAISGVGIDDFAGSLIKYLPSYIDLFSQVNLFRNLPLRKIQWEGSEIREHIRVQRNTGVAFIQDGGALPTPGKVNYIPATYGRRQIAGKVKISYGASINAKTTKHAVARVVDSELNGLLETLNLIQAFTGYRDGTGKIATLGSTVSGSTISVSDNPGLLMRDGEYEIRDAAAPTTVHIPLLRVESVNRALTSSEAVANLAASISAAGQAQGDGVYLATGGIASYGNALTGFEKLIDDAATGTFQGVALADYPEYASVVMDGGGSTQNMSTALFRRMLAALAFGMNKERADNYFVSTSTWDGVTFEELFEGSLRTVPDTKIGGVDVATFQSSFGKFSLYSDRLHPYGKMFFVDRNELSMPMQQEVDWVREPGGAILRASHEAGVYTGVAYGMYDLAVHNRAKMGKIENLAVNPQIAY